MTEFSFSVEGEPVAKRRPRFTVRTKRNGGQYVHTYTDEITAAGELAVLRTFQSAYPGHVALAGRISVMLAFYEGPRQVEKRQDLDNLIKLVLDALNGVAWVDDRQIVYLTAHVERDEPTRTIEVEDGTTVTFGPYTNVQFKTVDL